MHPDRFGAISCPPFTAMSCLLARAYVHIIHIKTHVYINAHVESIRESLSKYIYSHVCTYICTYICNYIREFVAILTARSR
jgi:hypothetical protein